MQLYRWRSDALRNYGRGYIIAMGTDVEDARNRARAQFKQVAEMRWSWLFDTISEYEVDEDDIRQRDEKIAELEEDIQGEPDVGDAFFIEGSE